MKLTLVLALGVLAISNATEGAAQSANFKCPPNGTVAEYSDGARTTWVEQVGNACRAERKDAAGMNSVFLWYAPLATTFERNNPGYVTQINPSRLWPLTVGKTVQAHYEGQGSTIGYFSKWDYAFTVEKTERITTKAGTFDTLVMLLHTKQLPPSNWEGTFRQWYAPELGVAVKYENSDNEGKPTSLSKAELTAIRRP